MGGKVRRQLKGEGGFYKFEGRSQNREGWEKENFMEKGDKATNETGQGPKKTNKVISRAGGAREGKRKTTREGNADEREKTVVKTFWQDS